jgi:hypothetical protein
MTVNSIHALLDKMWIDYVGINPLAQRIYDLLMKDEKAIINDHIALRTFNHPRLTVDVIAKPFLDSGYVYSGDYHFKEKNLYAKSYLHPNSHLPKIFISELKMECFSKKFQNMVNDLITQIPKGEELSFDFSSSGRPWNVTTQVYHELLKESDYAAWVAAFGYRPNHFTVFVNEMSKFKSIPELNEHLKAHDFKLNSSGGEIKGSPEVLLEQSSTLANNIEVQFADGVLTIPACYYEFAKRYPQKDGSLYQGFVAASADKIFESTNSGQ